MVIKHIEGLGFKMREKGKKTCVVDLKAKEHWKVLLELSYYSLSLSSIFVMESCFSHIASQPFPSVEVQRTIAYGDSLHYGVKVGRFV